MGKFLKVYNEKIQKFNTQKRAKYVQGMITWGTNGLFMTNLSTNFVYMNTHIPFA